MASAVQDAFANRLGFLVMDEFFDCWTVAKNPYDYHRYFNEWSKVDARDTIRRPAKSR